MFDGFFHAGVSTFIRCSLSHCLVFTLTIFTLIISVIPSGVLAEDSTLSPEPYSLEDRRPPEPSPSPSSTPFDPPPPPESPLPPQSPTPQPPTNPTPTPTPPECPLGYKIRCDRGSLGALGIEDPSCECVEIPEGECSFFTFTSGNIHHSRGGEDMFSWRGKANFNPQDFSCIHEIAKYIGSDMKTVHMSDDRDNYDSDDDLIEFLTKEENFYKFDVQLSIRKRIEEITNQLTEIMQNTKECMSTCTAECTSSTDYVASAGSYKQCSQSCRVSCSANNTDMSALHYEQLDLNEQLNELHAEYRRERTPWRNNPDSIFGFDTHCNLVVSTDPTDFCGNLHGESIPSPISLLWEDFVDIDEQVSVSTFQLNPYVENKYYTWKGSALTPLLVYDPEHTGRVYDASQLFGNWTFGGKQYSSLYSYESNRLEGEISAWRDGYEALAVLDANEDGVVSEAELKPLALWFDENRDGISQPGEVTPLLEHGVTKLFYKGAKTRSTTKDIYLSEGYERIIAGRTIRRGTVDWFGESSNSRLEALGKLSAEQTITQSFCDL